MTDSDQRPPTISVVEARSRLTAARFERLHVNPVRRGELWKNRFGKTVFIDFADDGLQFFWEESLNEALNQMDAQPVKL